MFFGIHTSTVTAATNMTDGFQDLFSIHLVPRKVVSFPPPARWLGNDRRGELIPNTSTNEKKSFRFGGFYYSVGLVSKLAGGGREY
jgi:hypothetical protein